MDSPGKLPALLIFQFTLAQKHVVEGSGLKKVDNLQFASYTNVRKYYVVVTTDNIQPQMTIPKTTIDDVEVKIGGKKGKTPEERFPMFHWPVDILQVFPPRPHD